MPERLNTTGKVLFSDDIAEMAGNIGNLELSSFLPRRLFKLNNYVQSRIKESMDKVSAKGQKVEVFGPDWARANPEKAGAAHAEVIIKTYGATYALPNKYPEQNVKALAQGNTDMYLIFENGIPAGTACMVMEKNGWAELGRSASLGSVGNEMIQNLRILKWLTDRDLGHKVFGLFSTCRTAPDRNVGTLETPEMMRGGQAVTHIWSKMPESKVGGFGPLYKKHGALEQFAYAFMTNQWEYTAKRPFILGQEDRKFVNDWANFYSIDRVSTSEKTRGVIEDGYTVHYPPLETGLTDLIHGEITMGKHGESFDDIDTSLARLEEVKVPFIQVQVPIDKDTLGIQDALVKRGFQAFLFTPGVMGKQSPLLWYGRLTPGVKVVPTFWENGQGKNPFWNDKLANFASGVARNWDRR